MPDTSLILASRSPRRQEILRQAAIPFEVVVAHVDERRLDGELPATYVMRLAQMKAEAIALPSSAIVLGADTTVAAGGDVLEKPSGAADARRMLRLLSGREHQVYTGVCLRSGRRTVVEVESTRVWFGRLSDAEIDAYVATGEPMDKAGAYAIQGIAGRYIERIEGCYFNVVGLPLARVWRLLQSFAGG